MQDQEPAGDRSNMCIKVCSIINRLNSNTQHQVTTSTSVHELHVGRVGFHAPNLAPTVHPPCALLTRPGQLKPSPRSMIVRLWLWAPAIGRVNASHAESNLNAERSFRRIKISIESLSMLERLECKQTLCCAVLCCTVACRTRVICSMYRTD